jgi:hypothetical protein
MEGKVVPHPQSRKLLSIKGKQCNLEDAKVEKVILSVVGCGTCDICGIGMDWSPTTGLPRHLKTTKCWIHEK